MLVAVPLLLLGAVSPWATRLKLATVEEAGASPGGCTRSRPSARWSACSSSSLWAIEAIGTQRTFIVLAAVPALVSAARPRRALAARPGACWSPRSRSRPGRPSRPRTAACSTRPRRPTSTRAWSRSPTARASSSSTRARRSTRCWRPGTVLTGGYWDGFLVLPFATGSGKPPARIAALGTAGGTVPRAYAHYFPDTRIDAVDIDPELFEIGRRYFGLERAAAAARDRAGRAAVPARDDGALRRDLRRRLPPALHPLLPDDARVLRARARPAAPGRLGDRQHRPPARLAASSSRR